MNDTLVWMPSTSGDITYCKSYVHLILSQETPPWTKHIWANYIPPPSSILLWRILNGHIPTEDILQQTGLSLPTHCSLCSSYGESISYLFLCCPYAMAL